MGLEITTMKMVNLLLPVLTVSSPFSYVELRFLKMAVPIDFPICRTPSRVLNVSVVLQLCDETFNFRMKKIFEEQR